MGTVENTAAQGLSTPQPKTLENSRSPAENLKSGVTAKMKAILKNTVVAVAVASAMASGSAMAASATDTATPFSVANNLDLRIVIPAFLYFRVGTDSATIDRITFSPTAAQLGTGAAIAGT